GWRLGMTLASINLLLIALASAYTSPRSGRSGNLLFAILSFAAYYNLINLGQGWVASERIGMAAMLLLLHGSVFAAALLWLIKQDRQWSLRTLWPDGRMRHAAEDGSH
nr:LptF/LptG family permease [Brachymonas sp.]